MTETENKERELLEVCKKGHRNVCISIIDSGISSDIIDKVTSIASKKGYILILEDMISRNILDYDIAAMEAAKRGRQSIVDSMIILGASDYSSIISGFVYGGYEDMVFSYIKRIDKNIDLDLLAYTACKRGHIRILLGLLSLGASDYDYMAYGAVEEGRIDILLILIDFIDTDTNDLQDLAKSLGHHDIVSYLEPTII